MADGLLAGPVGMRLGTAVGLRELGRASGALETANARLILLRSAYLVPKDGALTSEDIPVHRWAVATNMGQGPRAGTLRLTAAEPVKSARLVDELARRRAAALAALAEDGMVSVRTLELAAESALVTGTGAGGVRDVGIELHGTYGWPILPGSTLKGVAREWARQLGLPATEITGIFGSPPEADDPLPGSVAFFDALPWRYGVEITTQVLTPHTRGYRSATGADGPVTPGEHVNPVPISFLGVERGRFIACLAGPQDQVGAAAELLAEAVNELGVGAKTASGYGYLTVCPPIPEDPDPAPAEPSEKQSR